MKDFKLARKVIEECVKVTKKPITVKFRIGFEDGENIAVEFAKMCEEAGASAITVHGRTTSQGYAGNVDYVTIKKVKQAVAIPVIGNGDVIDGKTAKNMFEETGCDAIMIGRASNGNPWIFEQIIEYLTNGQIIEHPNVYNVKSMILKHLQMLVEYKGEYTAIREMRKQIAWYIKGMPNATTIRSEINKIEDLEELKEKILNI